MNEGNPQCSMSVHKEALFHTEKIDSVNTRKSRGLKVEQLKFGDSHHMAELHGRNSRSVRVVVYSTRPG